MCIGFSFTNVVSQLINLMIMVLNSRKRSILNESQLKHSNTEIKQQNSMDKEIKQFQVNELAEKYIEKYFVEKQLKLEKMLIERMARRQNLGNAWK